MAVYVLKLLKHGNLCLATIRDTFIESDSLLKYCFILFYSFLSMTVIALVRDHYGRLKLGAIAATSMHWLQLVLTAA